MQVFNNLEEIQARKQQIHSQRMQHGQKCQSLWNSLLHPQKQSLYETRSQKILSYAHNAAGAFDGLMLGWKLYRKLSNRKKR